MTARPSPSYLRVVDAARSPAPRRLEVRLTVRDGHEPIGRSRAFRLHDRDLDELIAHAARLEGRR